MPFWRHLGSIIVMLVIARSIRALQRLSLRAHLREIDPSVSTFNDL